MKKILTTTIAVIALAFTTFAQPGTIDTTFNPGTGADNAVRTTSIQSDGKIIIGGQFTSYNGTTRNYIARLNVDGTLDGSFNSGTNNNVWTTSIQSDGKIIIGGSFWLYMGNSINYIARLNVDGTLDGSFNPGTGADNVVWTTSIQSDGKIIIGGDLTTYNGTAINRIARLNVDGTLDLSFNPGTGADNTVKTTSIQSDGKIIIGGNFTSFNGTARSKIARLNVDGTLDLSFNPGTGASGWVLTTSIQSDGQLIIGGNFFSYNGTARSNIARLNVDGTLDGSFDPGTGVAGISSSVSTTSIQSDGQLIIGGNFTSYNGTVRSYIARLNVDATLDLSFNQGTGAESYVWTTSIQSNGQLIIGGDFLSYNGTLRRKVARINGGTTTGLSSISSTTSIIVYPNPFTTETTLQSDYLLKNATMTVYNIQGQVVKAIKNITGQTVALHRGNLPSGLYFIRLTEDNRVIMADKLVIAD